MLFFNPKNESITSLRLYFFAIAVGTMAYAMTAGFYKAPSLSLLDSSLSSVIQIASAISFLYFGLTLKNFLVPTKVRILRFFIVISFLAIAATFTVLNNIFDYISLIIDMLVTWYLYSAITHLSS